MKEILRKYIKSMAACSLVPNNLSLEKWQLFVDQLTRSSTISWGECKPWVISADQSIIVANPMCTYNGIGWIREGESNNNTQAKWPNDTINRFAEPLSFALYMTTVLWAYIQDVPKWRYLVIQSVLTIKSYICTCL